PISDRYLLINPEDIHDLSEQLELHKKAKNSNNTFLYIFGLSRKHKHILPTLSCLDTKKEQILFHILINSSENSNYINFISSAINYEPELKKSALPEIFDASIHVQIHQEDFY